MFAFPRGRKDPMTCKGLNKNARKAKSRIEKPDYQPKAGLKSRIKSQIGLIRLLAVPGQ